MKPREVLRTSRTPDGELLELAREAGHLVLRVAGVPLMSSARSGSETAMARIASETLGARGIGARASAPKRPGGVRARSASRGGRAPPEENARVLVGGLGMGFTLRAALDTFGPGARVLVAELLPALVELHRGVLGPLAGRPLEDRRVRLVEGDVRIPLREGGFDAVLMDVDNGPEAFTSKANASLYDDAGVRLMADALAPGGVLVVWSAHPEPRFERRLRRAGLRAETQRVYARGDVRKGGRHVLFVAQAPQRR